MDNKRFMEEIHAPYNEAYQLIKGIKDLSRTDPKDNDAWEKWVRDIDSFKEKYKDNDFGIAVYKMLLDAGDIIGKING